MTRDGWFVAGSAAAHALLVLALVAPWPLLRPAPPPTPDTAGAVEVVMVQQQAAPAGPTAAQAAPSPPADGVAPPRPAAPPAVNLGGDPSDPWSVHSDDIQPPAPDARFRNLPPRYPAEAMHRGESGTVELLIHVAPDGTADGADIVASSGFPTLDREARRAVLLWRFDPGRRAGAPAPFDYPISIHFTRDP